MPERLARLSSWGFDLASHWTQPVQDEEDAQAGASAGFTPLAFCYRRYCCAPGCPPGRKVLAAREGEWAIAWKYQPPEVSSEVRSVVLLGE